MFEQVRQAMDRLRGVVAELDPARLDGRQARRLVEEFAAIERLAGAGKALAMRRVEATRAWADSGSFRDAAAWLAATGGTTVGHARATVETSAHLEEFPETEAALRGGELSEVQVNEVVSAARSDPSAERLLLDSAKRDGVRGLKDHNALGRGRAPASTRRRAIRRSTTRGRYVTGGTSTEPAASTYAGPLMPRLGSCLRSSHLSVISSLLPAMRAVVNGPTRLPSTLSSR